MGLVEMGAEGYAGIPLRSVTGEVLGLFAVLYRTPIEDPLQLQHLLKIISVCISNELERIKDNEILEVKTSDLLLQNTRFEALY